MRLAGRPGHSATDYPGPGQLGIEIQRPFGVLAGAIGLADGEVHFGQAGPQRGVFTRQTAGFLHLGDGLGPGPATPEGFAIVAAGLGVDRTGGHRLGQQGFGVLLPPALERRHALLR